MEKTKIVRKGLTVDKSNCENVVSQSWALCGQKAHKGQWTKAPDILVQLKIEIPSSRTTSEKSMDNRGLIRDLYRTTDHLDIA